MLQAQKVIQEIERSLEESGFVTFALITNDGVVLESREKETRPSTLYPPHGDEKDNYSVTSKMQTKIFAVFAAELWQHNPGTQWAGAETHDRRLVVHGLSNPELMLLAVSDSAVSWNSIRAHAQKVAAEISKDI